MLRQLLLHQINDTPIFSFIGWQVLYSLSQKVAVRFLNINSIDFQTIIYLHTVQYFTTATSNKCSIKLFMYEYYFHSSTLGKYFIDTDR